MTSCVMKNILIAILLFVFAAQGCVVAVGAGPVEVTKAASLNERAGNPEPLAADVAQLGKLAPSDTDVIPSIEEMSDYVSIQIADEGGKDDAAPPFVMISPYISIVLPKAFPPPRA